LLAKALVDSGDDDDGGLGMELTHLVAAVVPLGVGEISRAIVCLAAHHVWWS